MYEVNLKKNVKIALESFFFAALGVKVWTSLLYMIRCSKVIFFYIFLSSDSETESKEKTLSSKSPLSGHWRSLVHFWALTGILSLIGPRVSSLVVLEFSLRAVSAWISARLVSQDTVFPVKTSF